MPDDRLCQVCKGLDFRKLTTKSLEQPWKVWQYFSSSGPIEKLSTFQRIKLKSSTCLFCRLVLESIFTVQDSTRGPLPKDGDLIELRNCPSWKMCIVILQFNGTFFKMFSNRADLEQEANSIRNLGRPEAQRLLLSWPSCEAFGQIQRVAIKNSVDDECFFGRLVRSNQIDWSLMRFWLRHCTKGHAEICQDSRAKSKRYVLHKSMRVLDTEKRSVVPYSSEWEYVALTYVWGEELMKSSTGRKMPTMNRQLVRTQGGPDGTIPLPHWLPSTINDSIKAVKLLGYRYLWVDSLCIVQDDDADRHSQLLRMDAIYRHASLSIAAASGSHADCGLPGMSIPRNFKQQRETLSGVTLSVPHPRFDELNEGDVLKWNTRAWTFQEKVLSRRLLIFTNHQVYFRCANGVWSEDTATETTRPSSARGDAWFAWGEHKLPRDYSTRRPYSLVDFLTFGSLELASSERYGLFANYAAVVKEYTQRTLTFQSDALPAIDGVLRVLDPSPVAYVAGIPRELFHQAMLWRPKFRGRATRISNSGAPSWSWAGWSLPDACVWDTREVQSTEVSVPDIVFWTKDQPEPRSLSTLKRPFMLLRELLPQVSDALRVSGSLLGWRATLRKEWTLGTITTLEFPTSRDDKVLAYEVRRSDTLVIGEIIATIGTIEEAKRRPFDFELVEISRGKGVRYTSKLIHKALRPKTTKTVYVEGTYIAGDETMAGWSTPGHYKQETTVDPPEQWKIVNVMLVERPGADNAFHRRGIGKVLVKEWEKLPVRKEFMVLG
ncbi:Heterokaryon incompatibility protein (HET) domain containing protein [Rhypophila decipiens]